ncbi:MAG: TolC family protein [Bacteroidales bacterium]|nr:TolC family protein [Bacteroidales bacterium]MBR4648484.1 TolC family protein [Bacteroidales bacterium]
MKSNWFFILTTLLMVGCGVQKPVVEEAVRPNLLELDIILVDSVPARSWQDIFVDESLQALISEALTNNADVRTMQLSVEQAAIQMRVAKLSYLPSFALSPSATVTKANGAPVSTSYELPLTMSWELNLGGQVEALKAATKYQWMNAQEQLKYTQLQLIASVANAYYTLIMLDEQLRLSEQSVQLQRETLETITAMKEVGMMNELAVNQAETELQATIASVSDLRLQREKTERALNLLLSRTPQNVQYSTFTDVNDINMDADSPVSLEALAMRPEVRSAEYQLRASFSNTKVARSQFYPSLKLTASGSWTNNIGEIVNPAKLLLNLIGGLTQPLFQMGQIKAGFEIAKSQQEQAQIAFEQALLQAGSEVANALSECHTAQQKLLVRKAQVEASRKAVENVRELMQYSSSVTYLEVLTAQSSWLNAQLQQTADWLELQQGKINLYKALCR